MTSRLLTLITILTLCVLSAFPQVGTYSINIGDFTELTVAHHLNVAYKCMPDSAGYAMFTCDRAQVSAVGMENKHGKLRVEILRDPDDRLPARVPNVTVYSNTLSHATNLGDSTLILQSTDPCESLSLRVIGNGFIRAASVYTTRLSAIVEAGSGHIFVKGQAQQAKFTLAGTGSIEAGELATQDVRAWMLGTGSIDCRPKDNLSVYGTTSGSLYYMGNPKIKKRCVGVKLVKMDE